MVREVMVLTCLVVFVLSNIDAGAYMSHWLTDVS